MTEKTDVQVELLRADHKYPSGYYYPRAEVDRAFAPDGVFMQRVRVGALRGEYGNPRRQPGESDDQYSRRVNSIDETRVSHAFKDVVLGENGVVTGVIAAAGPYGEHWSKQAETRPPRMAMRAMMSVERDRETGHIVPTPGTLSIITYDMVSIDEVDAAARMASMKNSYSTRDRRRMVLTKQSKVNTMAAPKNNSGRPGDIAIAGININQHVGKPISWPLARVFPVYRCCKDGTWMKIGSYGEWFGAPPGTPEDTIEMYPSPSGMIYEEMLGAHWSHVTHRKYFGEYDGRHGCVKIEDYLIAHYLTIPIPRRATQRTRIRNLEVKLAEMDRLEQALKEK